MDDIVLKNPNPISQFEFMVNGKWIIRIKSTGLEFNQELWPKSNPSDFAQAFCDILERNYDIQFNKRTPSSGEKQADSPHDGR